MGDPRERDRRASSQQALVDALPLTGGYPRAHRAPRAPRGDRALGASAASASALDPERADRADARRQGGDLLASRSSLVDAAAGKRHGRRHRAGLSRAGARARFAHAEVVRRCRSSRRTASCPTSTPSTRSLAPRRGPLGQLPEQPDRRRRAARRSTSAWPSSPRSTTSCSPRTRPTRSSGSTSRPPSALEVRGRGERIARLQLALEALVDDRLPLGLRRRRPGDRRRAAARSGPSSGTAPQEFVQRASIVAWEDEEHVERDRARYGRKRDALLGCSRTKGLRVAGQRGDDVPLGRRPGRARRSEAFAERLLEGGIVVTPGAYLGPSGEGYVRFALVPTEERVRRGRRAARRSPVSAELAREIEQLWERRRRRRARRRARSRRRCGCSTRARSRVAEPGDGRLAS